MPDVELSNRQINEICDRFEDLWQADKKPELKDFVVREDSIQAQKLFSGLIDLHLHYCMQQSWLPDRGELLHCYPEFSTIIHEKLDAEVGATAPAMRHQMVESLLNRKLSLAKQRGGQAVKDMADFLEPAIRLSLARNRTKQERSSEEYNEILRSTLERTQNAIDSTDTESVSELINVLAPASVSYATGPQQSLGHSESYNYSTLQPTSLASSSSANTILFARALENVEDPGSEILRLRLVENWSLPALTDHLQLGTSEVCLSLQAGLKSLRRYLDREFFALLQLRKSN